VAHARQETGPARARPPRGVFQRVVGDVARKNLAATKPLAGKAL
jgi:hypothetical protein